MTPGQGGICLTMRWEGEFRQRDSTVLTGQDCCLRTSEREDSGRASRQAVPGAGRTLDIQLSWLGFLLKPKSNYSPLIKLKPPPGRAPALCRAICSSCSLPSAPSFPQSLPAAASLTQPPLRSSPGPCNQTGLCLLPALTPQSIKCPEGVHPFSVLSICV